MDALIALTSEQIQKKKKEIRKDKILYGISAAIVLYSGPCSIFLFFISAMIGGPNEQEGMHGMVVAGVLVVIALFASLPMSYYQRYQDDEELYENLSRSQCEEMMKLINSVPEGKDFQQAILAQNRQFIQQDLMSIKWWKETASERHACKQLYEIA
jgi:hypothetical protein